MKNEANSFLEAIGNNQSILVSMPSNTYTKKTKRFTEELADLSQGICYVTLNKPSSTILHYLVADKKNSEFFLFVDATKKTEDTQEQQNVLFLTSPRAITELSIILSKILEKETMNIIFFDSLSSLLVYETEEVVTKFIRDLLTKLQKTKTKGVFIILEEDIHSNLIKNVSMIVDKTVTVTGDDYGSTKNT